MNSKRIVAFSLLVFGTLSTLAGIGFAGMYVFEAVIARIGEADQSLLFWYLPILFIGIFGITVGLGISAWGIIQLKKHRHTNDNAD